MHYLSSERQWINKENISKILKEGGDVVDRLFPKNLIFYM